MGAVREEHQREMRVERQQGGLESVLMIKRKKMFLDTLDFPTADEDVEITQMIFHIKSSCLLPPNS